MFVKRNPTFTMDFNFREALVVLRCLQGDDDLTQEEEDLAQHLAHVMGQFVNENPGNGNGGHHFPARRPFNNRRREPHVDGHRNGAAHPVQAPVVNGNGNGTTRS